MEQQQAFLILADISGYTKFIKLHRLSLIHAEQVISELLDSVLRPIVRHLDDPDSAWDEIEASEKAGKDLTIVGTLRKSYPETQERIHGKLKSHPAIAETRPLLEVADKKRALALQRGEKLRQLLERKL